MPAQDLPHPLLLAFDTSTERLSVALSDGVMSGAENLPGGAAASATLLPAIEALLARQGHPLAEVQAIAFGRGPGAFTGLRTSCAVAQGLAFGLNRPVLPIDSLLIVAEQVRQQTRQQRAAGDGFEVGVVMDARMGEVYAGRYRWSGGAWLALQAPGLWAPAALAEAWAAQPPQACTGSALELFDTQLKQACPADRRVQAGDDRAAALIVLARLAWAAGAGVDAAEALPLYLRDKVAQTTEERAALRAAAAPSLMS